jgi:chemotaxis protein methyltransferase CheR
MATLTDTSLGQLAARVSERFGITLTVQKLDMVRNRLQSMAIRRGFSDVELFAQSALDSTDDTLWLEIFDALSTNVTSFFRDSAHFACLEREFYAPLKNNTLTLPSSTIRIWSAACSIGAEPYSLAIQASEQLGDDSRWDVRILATDLSNSALTAAARAVYPDSMVESFGQDQLHRSFLQGKGPSLGYVKVKENIKRLVSTAKLNLLEPWPMKGPFNVIFCRNVMIYFDRPTREDLIRRMHDLLTPGGFFVLGSSESLSGLDVPPMQMAQPSVYRKGVTQ